MYCSYEQAAQITEAQKAEFKRAFTIFDKNNDGHISSSELADVMKQLGKNMSQAELDNMLREVDSDQNGTIEFNEFCVYMLNTLNKPSQDTRRKTFEVRTINAIILEFTLQFPFCNGCNVTCTDKYVPLYMYIYGLGC